MKIEFVTYEQATQLKEIGMDLGWDNYLQFYDSSTKEFCDVMKDVPAPLKQQVLRWFREKYNIIGLIEGGFDMTNIFTYCIWEGFKDKIYDDYYGTYEEAEDVLINILIDKIKNKL